MAWNPVSGCELGRNIYKAIHYKGQLEVHFGQQVAVALVVGAALGMQAFLGSSLDAYLAFPFFFFFFLMKFV